MSQLVLEREFFEDVRAGSRRSLALFVDMNDVFERIVERAFRAAAAETGLRVEGQASIPDLVDGPHAVAMRPDVLVRDAAGEPVLVADAKWKTSTDSPSSGDVYQLTSYILSLDVPGMLVYPGTNEVVATSDVDGHALQSVGFPTDAAVGSYEAYIARLEGAARRYL